MAHRTQSLFHFTSSFDILKIILSNGGFWPRCSREDFTWIKNTPYELGFPMVCFCDIPITRITDHVDYYGFYGIGLEQAWGKRKGLNPLIYLNEDSPLKLQIKIACKALLHRAQMTTATAPRVSDADRKEALNLLAYVKPLIGSTNHHGTTEIKDFYEESEWRYIPQDILNDRRSYLFDGELSLPGKIDEVNEFTRPMPLTFIPEDIRYIFVQHVNEIPLLFDHLSTHSGGNTHDQFKILISKIISLEDLNRDL